MKDQLCNVDKSTPAVTELSTHEWRMRVLRIEEVHASAHDEADPDTEYNKGFRNGIERALAIMQGREPNYVIGPVEPVSGASS